MLNQKERDVLHDADQYVLGAVEAVLSVVVDLENMKEAGDYLRISKNTTVLIAKNLADIRAAIYKIEQGRC